MSENSAHNRYWVYLLASRPNGTLYVGVTNSLERRMWEHKTGAVPGFTKKYHVTRLVYFEEHRRADDAIGREKEIKGWLRSKKIKLITQNNPRWDDLALGWHQMLMDSSLRSE